MIYRPVLAEPLRQRHHPLDRPSADPIALEAELARRVIQLRMDKHTLGELLPAPSEAHDGALALYRAAFEDETLVVLPGSGSGYRVRPFAALTASLAVQQAVPEIHIAVPADEIHRPVDLAVLEIMRSSFVIGEIRILMPEQPHVPADGLRALIPERHASSVIVVVVVQGVLYRQVLQPRSFYPRRDTQRRTLVDGLIAVVGLITDDRAFHRLADDRHAVSLDGGQRQRT